MLSQAVPKTCCCGRTLPISSNGSKYCGHSGCVVVHTPAIRNVPAVVPHCSPLPSSEYDSEYQWPDEEHSILSSLPAAGAPSIESHIACHSKPIPAIPAKVQPQVKFTAKTEYQSVFKDPQASAKHFHAVYHNASSLANGMYGLYPPPPEGDKLVESIDSRTGEVQLVPASSLPVLTEGINTTTVSSNVPSVLSAEVPISNAVVGAGGAAGKLALGKRKGVVKPTGTVQSSAKLSVVSPSSKLSASSSSASVYSSASSSRSSSSRNTPCQFCPTPGSSAATGSLSAGSALPPPSTAGSIYTALASPTGIDVGLNSRGVKFDSLSTYQADFSSLPSAAYTVAPTQTRFIESIVRPNTSLVSSRSPIATLKSLESSVSGFSASSTSSFSASPKQPSARAPLRPASAPSNQKSNVSSLNVVGGSACPCCLGKPCACCCSQVESKPEIVAPVIVIASSPFGVAKGSPRVWLSEYQRAYNRPNSTGSALTLEQLAPNLSAQQVTDAITEMDRFAGMSLDAALAAGVQSKQEREQLRKQALQPLAYVQETSDQNSHIVNATEERQSGHAWFYPPAQEAQPDTADDEKHAPESLLQMSNVSFANNADPQNLESSISLSSFPVKAENKSATKSVASSTTPSPIKPVPLAPASSNAFERSEQKRLASQQKQRSQSSSVSDSEIVLGEVSSESTTLYHQTASQPARHTHIQHHLMDHAASTPTLSSNIINPFDSASSSIMLSSSSSSLPSFTQVTYDAEAHHEKQHAPLSASTTPSKRSLPTSGKTPDRSFAQIAEQLFQPRSSREFHEEQISHLQQNKHSTVTTVLARVEDEEQLASSTISSSSSTVAFLTDPLASTIVLKHSRSKCSQSEDGLGGGFDDNDNFHHQQRHDEVLYQDENSVDEINPVDAAEDDDFDAIDREALAHSPELASAASTTFFSTASSGAIAAATSAIRESVASATLPSSSTSPASLLITATEEEVESSAPFGTRQFSSVQPEFMPGTLGYATFVAVNSPKNLSPSATTVKRITPSHVSASAPASPYPSRSALLASSDDESITIMSSSSSAVALPSGSLSTTVAVSTSSSKDSTPRVSRSLPVTAHSTPHQSAQSASTSSSYSREQDLPHSIPEHFNANDKTIEPSSSKPVTGKVSTFLARLASQQQHQRELQQHHAIGAIGATGAHARAHERQEALEPRLRSSPVLKPAIHSVVDPAHILAMAFPIVAPELPYAHTWVDGELRVQESVMSSARAPATIPVPGPSELQQMHHVHQSVQRQLQRIRVGAESSSSKRLHFAGSRQKKKTESVSTSSIQSLTLTSGSALHSQVEGIMSNEDDIELTRQLLNVWSQPPAGASTAELAAFRAPSQAFLLRRLRQYKQMQAMQSTLTRQSVGLNPNLTSGDTGSIVSIGAQNQHILSI